MYETLTTDDCHVAFSDCPYPNECEVPVYVWRPEIGLDQSHKSYNRDDDNAIGLLAGNDWSFLGMV